MFARYKQYLISIFQQLSKFGSQLKKRSRIFLVNFPIVYAFQKIMLVVSWLILMFNNMNVTFLLQWRDHWMQAVYYPSSPLPVTSGCHFSVYGSHDEYSLWFDTHNTQGYVQRFCLSVFAFNRL